MAVHQVFAQVSGGKVENIFICDNYELANWLSRQAYGDGAVAVECSQYPCVIGDTYHDGQFWRVGEDGEETQVPYIPTPEQQVEALSAENIALQQQLTDTQLALCEVYELMG